ncbi:MAG TPA: hypothetical protein VG890_15490 [Puia sp.]|nr:hypothetical protein [Puia sp.]
MQKTESPAVSRTRRKTWLFRLLSIALPLILLILLEISLRLFNYGYDLRLFVEYPVNREYLVMNPNAAKRYFNDPALAPAGNHEPFRKIKGKNTFRIFVLGESTTIGYPYFHNGSFHRWLQYRLMRNFPDRDFEIINLSLTAVNSYTVLGFAREIVNYEPDAVLIYTGHNEYYGTLGVGSTSRISGNPRIVQCVLAMRQLRIVQLASAVYRKVLKLTRHGNGVPRGTMMQLVAGDQHIPYGSEIYRRGIDQFRTNLDEALDVLNQHHVPVFLGSLVCNDRDQQPFVSIPPDNAHAVVFRKYYDEGVKAFEQGDVQSSLACFTAANKIYSDHALCNYYVARLYYVQRDYAKAKTYFEKARTLDGLRFRASEELNGVIRELCGRYPDAHLADAKNLFEANIPDHIIGAELMLEHVHPNLAGYALLSEAFYEAIKKQGLFPDPPQREMSFAELRQQMPVTRVDSLAGSYKIKKLKSSWPFSEPFQADTLPLQTEEDRLAYNMAFRNLHWPQAMENLYRYYLGLGRFADAKTVAESLVLEYPQEAVYYSRAANLYGRMGDLENAAFYFRKAFMLSPGYEEARFLFVIYLDLDRPEDAIPFIDYSIDNNISTRKLIPIKQYTQDIIRLERTAAKDTSNLNLLMNIADRYALMGNQMAASKYITRILERNPANEAALALKKKVEQEKAPSPVQ